MAALVLRLLAMQVRPVITDSRLADRDLELAPETTKTSRLPHILVTKEGQNNVYHPCP